MFRKLPIILILLIILLSSSCRRDLFLPETTDAHYLLYKVEYLEDFAGDIPTRILPSSMEAWYTKHFVVTKIEGFFSQFSLIQIADLRTRRISTLLNVFGNKVYYRSAQGELPASLVVPESISFTKTRENVLIGGLNSRRVEVETEKETYSIYYTDEFSVRRPNLSTPYVEIEEPLTDFTLQLSYLKMHLSGKRYEERLIETKIFDIPEEYRAVSRQTMEQIINSLFTKE